jgi:hypothetical protein
MPRVCRVRAAIVPHCAATSASRAKEDRMRTIQDGYRGISLLLDLAWDRVFFSAIIAVGLMIATAIAHGFIV